MKKVFLYYKGNFRREKVANLTTISLVLELLSEKIFVRHRKICHFSTTEVAKKYLNVARNEFPESRKSFSCNLLTISPVTNQGMSLL